MCSGALCTQMSLETRLYFAVLSCMGMHEKGKLERFLYTYTPSSFITRNEAISMTEGRIKGWPYTAPAVKLLLIMFHIVRLTDMQIYTNKHNMINLKPRDQSERLRMKL